MSDLPQPPGDALLEALAHAFAAGVTAPPRARHSIHATPDVSLLLMPAWGLAGLAGVKVVAVGAENANSGLPTVSGRYLLLDARSGRTLDVLDAHALTLRRTAAVSALAAATLAPTSARTLLLAATGDLARPLAVAHASVRQYRQVLVWGRRIERAARVAHDLTAGGLPALAVDDLARACGIADVISCATLSTEPLVRSEWLRDGTYVDLVGSFRPDMREADDALFARAAVVVDTETALVESGDLIGPLERGLLTRDRVRELGAVLRGESVPDAPVLVFKSVGTALADLCAAAVATGHDVPRARVAAARGVAGEPDAPAP